MYLLIGQVFSLVIAFIYTIQIARHLGPTGFGVISLALSFTAIFAPLATLGLNTLATREVAKEKSLASKYLGNLAIIELMLAAGTFGLIFFTAYLLKYPQETITVICIIALALVCNSYTGIFNSMFQAFERMEYVSFGTILNNVVTLAVVTWATIEGLNILWFSFSYLISSLLVLVYSLTAYGVKFRLPRIQLDFTLWTTSIRQGLPFALTGLFVMVYYYIDSVMLSLMKGDEAVGWYSASVRIILALLFIPTILNMVMFPVMSRFYVTAESSLRLAYEKYFKYMAIIAAPIGVGITLLATNIILLIYGVAYTNSTLALQILIWSTVFIFLGQAFARLFETTNRQTLVTEITAVGMAANVGLNFALIPAFSYIGASVATTLTELIALSLCFFVGSRMEYALPKTTPICLLKICIASLGMAVSIIFLEQLGLFSIFPAIAVYVVIIYFSRTLEKDDIVLIRRAVWRAET
ncbi:MAG: flippase [Halobacteriota archaeon]